MRHDLLEGIHIGRVRLPTPRPMHDEIGSTGGSVAADSIIERVDRGEPRVELRTGKYEARDRRRVTPELRGCLLKSFDLLSYDLCACLRTEGSFPLPIPSRDPCLPVRRRQPHPERPCGGDGERDPRFLYAARIGSGFVRRIEPALIRSCWASQKPVEEMYELHKSLGSLSP